MAIGAIVSVAIVTALILLAPGGWPLEGKILYACAGSALALLPILLARLATDPSRDSSAHMARQEAERTGNVYIVLPPAPAPQPDRVTHHHYHEHVHRLESPAPAPQPAPAQTLIARAPTDPPPFYVVSHLAAHDAWADDGE